MKSFIFTVALAALMFFQVPTVQAQTYYYPSNEQARQQLIAEIERLLAQLATFNTNTTCYTPVVSTPLPPIYVSGAVNVRTNHASLVSKDSASVYGDINLNGQSQAKVWFDYGRSQSFGSRSPYAYVSSSYSAEFRGDLSNLDDDTRYYYRAVAEVNGYRNYGTTLSFTTTRANGGGSSRYNDDAPDVETQRATRISDRSADLEGEVDMNDFNNGLVFVAYGEDEDLVEEIEDEYDEYRDIDEEGDDLQVFVIDNDLDNQADYNFYVTGLDDDTEYFYSLCVEFEDEDDDSKIICGGVEDFETDRD